MFLGDFFLRPSGSFFSGFRVFWVFFASEEFLVLFLEFYGFLGESVACFRILGFLGFFKVLRFFRVLSILENLGFGGLKASGFLLRVLGFFEVYFLG